MADNSTETAATATPPIPPADAEAQELRVQNIQKLFKYVVNCTEDEEPFGLTSTVTSQEEVWKPLVPVTVNSTYKGTKINPPATERVIQAVQNFLNYKRPGYVMDLEHPPNWVLFEHGTFILLPEPSSNDVDACRQEATRLLGLHGPVLMGSDQADVSVVKLKPELYNGTSGWLVFGHIPAFAVFVGENELEGQSLNNYDAHLVAFYGREKRHLDAMGLVVVHQEIRN